MPCHLLVCQHRGGRLHVVEAIRSGRKSADLQIRAVEIAQLAAQNKRATVVALLPKSAYLLRTLEIPRVTPDEARRMLALEAEAQLPPEFGEVEISFRQIAARKEGTERYEVYVIRRSDLANQLAPLAQAGLALDLALPSAVTWDLLLSQTKLAALAGESDGDGQTEVAFRGHDDVLNVRSIGGGGLGAVGTAAPVERALVECVRSLSNVRASAGSGIDVAWFGPRPALNGLGEVIRFVSPASRELSAGVPRENASDATSLEATFLTAVATCLARGDVSATLRGLQTCNLLPRESVVRKETRAALRSLAAAAIAAVLVFVFLYAALEILIRRYSAISADLQQKTTAIKVEGEAIGRHIEQLRAIRAARLTRRQLSDTLSALYRASPPGVTYNLVEVSKDGAVRLNGQATSLSLPFLLPEKLAQTGTFDQVFLRDAGQSKKGEGSIAEFRIDSRLVTEAGAGAGATPSSAPTPKGKRATKGDLSR